MSFHMDFIIVAWSLAVSLVTSATLIASIRRLLRVNRRLREELDAAWHEYEIKVGTGER